MTFSGQIEAPTAVCRLDHVDRGAVGSMSDLFVIREASLAESPAAVLESVARAREQRRLIAVEDVGCTPRSLTLLPLIEPDVIVLTPELTESEPDSAEARAVHVLASQAERTGAVIVARGIDTDVRRDRALALGATLGVGTLYPVGEEVSARTSFVDHPTWSTPDAQSRSPYTIASSDRVPIRSSKRLLVQMSTQIEAQAASSGADTLALGTFQYARQFGSRTRARWTTIAQSIAYTGVYGVRMDSSITSPITHHALDPDDDLVDEWNVVVLGQFYCCVLSARDRQGSRAEQDREFDYVVSHDRGTVVKCARAILSRFGR